MKIFINDNTNKRSNTTMARSATMKPENQSPHGALVARFNNVLKHFAKIDPEGKNIHFDGRVSMPHRLCA